MNLLIVVGLLVFGLLAMLGGETDGRGLAQHFRPNRGFGDGQGGSSPWMARAV